MFYLPSLCIVNLILLYLGIRSHLEIEILDFCVRGMYYVKNQNIKISFINCFILM